jgi:cobyrinic acid a,c-diamide synthase
MSLIIAGERSGVGKTTVTMAILTYLSRHLCPKTVQSFKVGPDYIDPMFHAYVTGRPCRNLDPVLTSEAYVQSCFAKHSQSAQAAVIEGVMGAFDGASQDDDWASTAHIGRLLGLPMLLVVDCSRLSRSVAALVHGYTTYDIRLNWAGVVLNRVGSDRHLELLKSALTPLKIPILGAIRRHDDIAIPSRHLGLIPTDELPELNACIDRLDVLAETWFDWETLLPLTTVKRNETKNSAPPCFDETFVGANDRLYQRQPCVQLGWAAPYPKPDGPKIAIAIAYDRAFNFYYADNLDFLRQLGAELVFWSPIADDTLPSHVSGLYLGGGFPEIFAQELASNLSAQASVKSAILAGMPVYAECGGLMYLCDRLIDYDGNSWPMVGVIPAGVSMQQQLTLGYRRATAQRNSPLIPAGTMVWGHEFHHSRLEGAIANPFYELRGYHADSATVLEGWQHNQLHASYLHLHWGIYPEIPQQFLKACFQFVAAKGGQSSYLS